MPDDLADFLAQFSQLLNECQALYASSAEIAVREQETLAGDSGDKFVGLMNDLHQALLVKVFVAVAESDRQWTAGECALAKTLINHLWRRELEADELREAILEMSQKAMALKWYALVRPFDQIAALRNRVGELETIVVRLAHLVARVDGPMKDSEAARIKSIQDELRLHLRPIPIDEPAVRAEAEEAAPAAIEKILHTGDSGRAGGVSPLPKTPPQLKTAPPKPTPQDTAAQLKEALAELDVLIGLADVKHEVRTLANFLKVQSRRTEAGLPGANLSLHMVFHGNPGTGKTSVARIVGKIFGAMGILAKGHLVETDRSGLVAQYAGQTAPKSHKKVDEALDGVLFIDEAYALAVRDGDDPYGQEAVQTLLKRMEDDRHRLVVILAGYPEEMQQLLESNPGLTSRFSRQLTFADYSPLELACIFAQMCNKNHYRLDSGTRAKTILGLTWLHAYRDEHFGNGRTVRNLFEHAIRRQANRIAEVTELSVDELATLKADDVEFRDCPAEVLARLADDDLRFHIECPHCRHGKDVPEKYLSLAVRCPKCKKGFTPEWGTIVDPALGGRSHC